MRHVTDAFLLNVAEVSATLIGLFLVGVFFYVETGYQRLGRTARAAFEPYFRSGTRIVLILYALPLGLSLGLVVLDPIWNTLLFAILSVMLVAANVDSFVRVWGAVRAAGSSILLVNELLGSAAVLTVVVVPWALGGSDPSREDLTWAILVSFAAGFLSVSALVLSVFDTGQQEPVSLSTRPDSS